MLFGLRNVGMTFQRLIDFGQPSLRLRLLRRHSGSQHRRGGPLAALGGGFLCSTAKRPGS
jgi:hypothetical protein